MKSIRRAFMLVACTLVVILVPHTVQAQSFNCARASGADEVLICQSPVLSRLDERMSSLYFRLRNRLSGGERRSLEAEQAQWLRSRMGCGRDFRCVESGYRRRIEELQNY